MKKEKSGINKVDRDALPENKNGIKKEDSESSSQKEDSSEKKKSKKKKKKEKKKKAKKKKSKKSKDEKKVINKNSIRYSKHNIRSCKKQRWKRRKRGQ